MIWQLFDRFYNYLSNAKAKSNFGLKTTVFILSKPRISFCLNALRTTVAASLRLLPKSYIVQQNERTGFQVMPKQAATVAHSGNQYSPADISVLILVQLFPILLQLLPEPLVPTGGDHLRTLLYFFSRFLLSVAEKLRQVPTGESERPSTQPPVNLLVLDVVPFHLLVGFSDDGDGDGEDDEDEEKDEGDDEEAQEDEVQNIVLNITIFKAVQRAEDLVAVHQPKERLTGPAKGAELAVHQPQHQPAAAAEGAEEDEDADQKAAQPGQHMANGGEEDGVRRVEGQVANETDPEEEVSRGQRPGDHPPRVGFRAVEHHLVALVWGRVEEETSRSDDEQNGLEGDGKEPKVEKVRHRAEVEPLIAATVETVLSGEEVHRFQKQNGQLVAGPGAKAEH